MVEYSTLDVLIVRREPTAEASLEAIFALKRFGIAIAAIIKIIATTIKSSINEKPLLFAHNHLPCLVYCTSEAIGSADRWHIGHKRSKALSLLSSLGAGFVPAMKCRNKFRERRMTRSVIKSAIKCRKTIISVVPRYINLATPSRRRFPEINGLLLRQVLEKRGVRNGDRRAAACHPPWPALDTLNKLWSDGESALLAYRRTGDARI